MNSERADDVRARDDPNEAFPFHDRNRTEPGRNHLLRRLGKRRLGSDFRRFFEDRRDFCVRREVASAHELAHRHDANELLAFEDREFVDVVRLHLAQDIPEGLVRARGDELRGHEVGHMKVLDLVPLHGKTCRG